VQPGDIRYEDLNGDSKINDDDITNIGYPIVPQIIYGISPSVQFRSLSLDLLFQGAARTSFYGSDGYSWAFFNNMNVLVDNLDYWTPDHTNARNPRITNAPTPNNSQVSSYWMHNASYLRLKSAMLSFNLPPSFTNKLKIQNVRVYAGAQNLLTWTQIRNYDPEIVNNGGLNYPLQKVISFGLNVTF
jgi:hypothetical protein